MVCKMKFEEVSFAVQRVAENFGEIPRESQLFSESPRQFVMSQTVTDSPRESQQRINGRKEELVILFHTMHQCIDVGCN